MVFRKSLVVFCNSTESSIVFLGTNFVIFLEIIRIFLNVDTQLWDALNTGYKFPIFSWPCKAHLSIDIMNYEFWFNSCNKFIMCIWRCKIIFLYDFHLNVIVLPCLNWRSETLLNLFCTDFSGWFLLFLFFLLMF